MTVNVRFGDGNILYHGEPCYGNCRLDILEPGCGVSATEVGCGTGESQSTHTGDTEAHHQLLWFVCVNQLDYICVMLY